MADFERWAFSLAGRYCHVRRSDSDHRRNSDTSHGSNRSRHRSRLRTSHGYDDRRLDCGVKARDRSLVPGRAFVEESNLESVVEAVDFGNRHFECECLRRSL